MTDLDRRERDVLWQGDVAAVPVLAYSVVVTDGAPEGAGALVEYVVRVRPRNIVDRNARFQKKESEQCVHVQLAETRR